MQTTIWYCDACGNEIHDPQAALVTWDFNKDNEKHEFFIIHKGRICDRERGSFSMELSDMLGAEGQEHLLSFLSYGPLPRREGQPKIENMDQFVDLFRRLHTPGYEEARRYFHLEEVRDEFSGANEYAAYTPASMARIIKIGRTSKIA